MKITLGVGESRRLSIAGARFYYEKGLGRIAVRTEGNDAGYFELSPGMGFQNRPDQMNFPAIVVTNLDDEAQDIEFVVSYREVFDNRITFGDDAVVSVMSPLKAYDVQVGTNVASIANNNISDISFDSGSYAGKNIFELKIKVVVAGNASGTPSFAWLKASGDDTASIAGGYQFSELTFAGKPRPFKVYNNSGASISLLIAYQYRG